MVWAPPMPFSVADLRSVSMSFLLLLPRYDLHCVYTLSQEVEATRSVTGYFEVSVNGKLVHSKKVSGMYKKSRLLFFIPILQINT